MISIDPGVHRCGMSTWTDGKLIQAAWIETMDLANGGTWQCELVVEIPVVYQGRKQKGDPNDLIQLALAVGRIVGGAEATFLKPREWKGQVPKAVMCKRILSKLTAQELEVLGDLKKNHNVVDSVGIGLFALNRL